MTCLQELLFGLASAIQALNGGDAVACSEKLREVFRHLRSHGVTPEALANDLISCQYEERRTDV